MRFLKAYLSGWYYSFRKIKMWGLLFLFNLLMAMACTIPLLRLLDQRLGQSLSLQKVLPDFDYTVYNDLMHEYGEGISVILDQSWIQIFLFFILWIFLTGGVLKIFKERSDRFSFQTFWKGCTSYFWRIFRLTIYFLGVHILLFSIFSGLFIALAGSGPGEYENELVFLQILKIVGPIYLFLTTIVLMIHDYAKIRMVHEDRPLLFGTIWRSVVWVFRNFGSAFLLYLLNFLTFFLLAAIYWMYNKTGKINSTETLLIAFIIGQLFLWLRIGGRLVNLSSAMILYEGIEGPKEVETPRLIAENEVRTEEASNELG